MTNTDKTIENGMYFSDRCQFCHEFGEKVEPYLCPKCIEKIQKLGYYKLYPDQSFPGVPSSFYGLGDAVGVYQKAQQDMLNQNWKRVIE